MFSKKNLYKFLEFKYYKSEIIYLRMHYMILWDKSFKILIYFIIFLHLFWAFMANLTTVNGLQPTCLRLQDLHSYNVNSYKDFVYKNYINYWTW